MNLELMRVQDDLLGVSEDLGLNTNMPLIGKSIERCVITTYVEAIERNLIVDWLDVVGKNIPITGNAGSHV